MRAFRLIAAIGAAAVLTAVASGCSESVTVPGLGTINASQNTRQTCFIADVSGSTYGPRIDGTYRRAIFAAAAIDGKEGSGRLCVMFASGPQVQGGSFHQADVGPDNPDDSGSVNAEVAAKVGRATVSLQAALANPPAHAIGSWLCYAVSQAAANQGLRSGDEIVFLSDMFESSSYLDMARDNTFDDGIAQVLAALRRDGQLPNLDGVTLRAPFVNESGRLDPATGTVDRTTKLSAGRRARVIRFWQLYADATNATFTRKMPVSPIDVPPWVTQGS